MPAINITDLNNGKKDLDHIAEFAISTAPTTTDRRGNVKTTLHRLVEQFPDAATKAAQAAASAASARTAQVAAEAARDAVRIGQLAGVVGKDTLANLGADLAHEDGTIAYVTNDPASEANTTYRKSGAAGAGIWVPSLSSPVDVLRATLDARVADVTTLTGEPFAIVDKHGNVALSVGDDGAVDAAVLSAGELKPKKISFAGSDTTDAAVIGFEHVVTDANGNIVWGVREDGGVHIAHLTTGNDFAQPGGSGTFQTLTLANSDTIANIGDSYTASHYTLKDKAFVSLLSALSPYRHQTFGVAGNDSLDMNYRIVNNQAYFDGKTFSDMRPAYSMVAAFTNDVEFWQADLTFMQENLSRLVETLLSVGTEPIVCTEFPQTATNRSIHKAVADKHQVRFVDSSPVTAELGGLPVGPFMQGHPGTRNNGIFWIDMLRAVDAIPRPAKGIKVFRRRADFAPTTIADLLYKTRIDRMAKWKELSLTHYRLSDQAQQYYDELDGPNVYDYIVTSDEYWALQKNQAVHFDDFALIEIVLPGTAMTLDEVRLTLGVPATATVYVRNYLDSAASIPGKAQGATPALPDYIDKWNRPRGAWHALGTYAGAISLTAALRGAMEGDTMTVLIHDAGGFDLTDIAVDYRGVLGKPARRPAAPRLLATGPELLANPACANADMADWTVQGAPVTLVPIDQGSAPRNPLDATQPVAGVCIVTAADTIGQTAAIAPGTSGKRLRLTVWVRHFPKAFLMNSGAGSYNLDPDQVIDRLGAGIAFATHSQITPDTNDLRTLRLEWCLGAAFPVNGGVQLDEFACLSWRAVEFDIDIPPAPQAGTSFIFRLSCPDGQIQIAKASFKECN